MRISKPIFLGFYRGALTRQRSLCSAGRRYRALPLPFGNSETSGTGHESLLFTRFASAGHGWSSAFGSLDQGLWSFQFYHIPGRIGQVLAQPLMPEPSIPAHCCRGGRFHCRWLQCLFQQEWFLMVAGQRNVNSTSSFCSTTSPMVVGSAISSSQGAPLPPPRPTL